VGEKEQSWLSNKGDGIAVHPARLGSTAAGTHMMVAERVSD